MHIIGEKRSIHSKKFRNAKQIQTKKENIFIFEETIIRVNKFSTHILINVNESHRDRTF